MAQMIVVIDRSQATRAFFSILLSEVENYVVVLCSTSGNAYQCVLDNRPDVIILDPYLETPQAGWAVLEQIKHDPLLLGIPVILCTADQSDIKAHAELLEHRGCVVVAKPFDVDDFLDVLRIVCTRKDNTITG